MQWKVENHTATVSVLSPQNQALRRQGDVAAGSKHLQCLPKAVTCQPLISPVWENVTKRELSVSSEGAKGTSASHDLSLPSGSQPSTTSTAKSGCR